MTPEQDLADAPSFIERQFPVAKVSAESFREREAKQGQLLTGLGKWWGRKPLVLVRATLLGILLPATDDPEADREVFLKLMSMDGDGLWARRKKRFPLPVKLLYELLPEGLRREVFTATSTADAPRYASRLPAESKERAQRIAFDSLPFDEKIGYCERVELTDGPTDTVWDSVNSHLGTAATSLAELVAQLGERRFGRVPVVGDAFCGAGSIPFEAAHLGCTAVASDLNPVAALLTWASLNIIGGGEQVVQEAEAALATIYAEAEAELSRLGVDTNELGWRADYYLYCVEVTDPESGFRVPLAPSWVIGKGSKTFARLVADIERKAIHIEIEQGADDEAMRAASQGTIVDSMLRPPKCIPGNFPDTPLAILRAATSTSSGLRLWENDDLVPRLGDVFGERLYCIRWQETYFVDAESGDELWRATPGDIEPPPSVLAAVAARTAKALTRDHYMAPNEADLEREARVLREVQARLHDWQQRGIVPARAITPGAKTDEPVRTRGWTHWHHLYTPRQLLTNGLLLERLLTSEFSKEAKAAALLAVGRCADWNSRLCRWNSDAANEKSEQTFSNQALNTLYNFANRTLVSLATTWFPRMRACVVNAEHRVVVGDCRVNGSLAGIWITDPPYADAIRYEEITELILNWYCGVLERWFPEWPTDTRRALAVRDDGTFATAMMQCYRNLATNMPDNGVQLVMFTHQDPAVWADLAVILWAAGLRVTSAWCVQTERQAGGTRSGNYVQGTVVLVLRKRTSAEEVFLDEVNQQIEIEVRRQLDSMTALDDRRDPNFSDTDYQLAAYAAALRVLTSSRIEEIDPERELAREVPNGAARPVEQLIRNAVKIACDHLVPSGIDREIWKSLGPAERFYLKGLEVETHGERRSGVYQELARGFGAADYAELLASDRANETRLKTAAEFGRRLLAGEGFAASLVRQVLAAVHKVSASEQAREGLNWLKTELADYWGSRERIAHLLDFLAALRRVAGMEHWHKGSDAALLLAGAVRNDHI